MSNYSPFQSKTSQSLPASEQEALERHAEFMKEQQQRLSGIQAAVNAPHEMDEEALNLLGLSDEERSAELERRETQARDDGDTRELLRLASLRARVQILEAREIRRRKREALEKRRNPKE